MDIHVRSRRQRQMCLRDKNLSENTGRPVECGLIGADNSSAIAEVTELGATKVYTIEDPLLARFSGDNMVSAAAHIVSASEARIVRLLSRIHS